MTTDRCLSFLLLHHRLLFSSRRKNEGKKRVRWRQRLNRNNHIGEPDDILFIRFFRFFSTNCCPFSLFLLGHACLTFIGKREGERKRRERERNVLSWLLYHQTLTSHLLCIVTSPLYTYIYACIRTKDYNEIDVQSRYINEDLISFLFACRVCVYVWRWASSFSHFALRRENER